MIWRSGNEMKRGGEALGKWMQMMEKWVGGGPGGSKRMNTFRWLVIIGLCGVAILILNSFVSVQEVDPLGEGRASPAQSQEVFMNKDGKDTMFEDYEHQYESRIKDILETIVGVGEVEVLVTVDSTEEIIVERNTRESQQVTKERDQNGADRHITDITRDRQVVLHEVSGDQNPIIVKKIKPKIRGVVVVAKGAENLTVKKMIVEAIRRGLDVPPHRIWVSPRKQ
jgi:stage III sporulation protein AG